MTTAVGRRLAVAALLVPALLPLAASCRPKNSLRVDADGATTVASGANSVRTNADGSVPVKSADGSSIDVSAGDVRRVGAQAPSGPPTATTLVTLDGTSGAVVFDESDQHRDVACVNGGGLAVRGSDNTLTVTGPCAFVRVSGNDNTIAVTAAAEIATSGNDNTITFGAGVGGRGPVVTTTGEDNTVARGGR